MSSRRRSLRDEEGQAVAEFALVLPPLLLILLAILQFGIVFKDYLELTDAVRAGARVGAVSRNEADPALMTKNAVVAAAPSLGAALEVETTSSWEPASQVEVVGRYPYAIKLLNVITIADGVLVSTTRERVE